MKNLIYALFLILFFSCSKEKNGAESPFVSFQEQNCTTQSNQPLNYSLLANKKETYNKLFDHVDSVHSFMNTPWLWPSNEGAYKNVDFIIQVPKQIQIKDLVIKEISNCSYTALVFDFTLEQSNRNTVMVSSFNYTIHRDKWCCNDFFILEVDDKIKKVIRSKTNGSPLTCENCP